MRLFALLTVASSVAFAGCDAPATAPPAAAPIVNSSAPPPPPPGPAAVPPPAMQEVVIRDSAEQVLGINAPGQKGADYTWSYTRVLFTNYFGVRETVALGQAKQALQIFESTKGYKPRTNEEGMEAMKDVPLPELEDDTFWYEFDPEKQELIVVHKEQVPVQP